MEKRRWYDNLDNTNEVFEQLKQLDETTKESLSIELINIVSALKEDKKDKEYIPISIGLRRVLGLYQSNKNRRWYDQCYYMSQALKAISTLSEQDIKIVIKGLDMTLNEG